MIQGSDRAHGLVQFLVTEFWASENFKKQYGRYTLSGNCCCKLKINKKQQQMNSVIVPTILLQEVRTVYKQNKWEWYYYYIENQLFSWNKKFRLV